VIPKPAAVVLTLCFAAGASSAAAEPGGPVIIDLGRVPPGQAERLARLLPEWDEAIEAGTTRLTVPADRVGPLRAAGFDVTVVGAAPVAPEVWPACYLTLDETFAWARALADAHPDLVRLEDIGDSRCKALGGCRTPGGEPLPGADILVLRVTSRRAPELPEGRLWIDAGLHAREIPTTEVVRAFVERLVAGYGRDAQITYLLDHRELVAGLMSNPDGRQLVELGTKAPYLGGPWYWRKNANADDGACAWPPTASSHLGVDLNRNHAFKWDAEGGSQAPCDQTYRGRVPASEPETSAYEGFVRTLFPDQRGPADTDAAPADTTGMLVNFHNATNPGTVLMPWGWTTARSANDADLAAIAARYVADNGYRAQYALYPVSGNTRDWGYGELGIPSYVVELVGDDFFTPCEQLPGVIAGQLGPLLTSLGLSDRPYERIRGPEVVRVAVPPAVRQGEPLVIGARLTELRSGRGLVAAGEVAVGPSGAGLAMTADDGAFDARSEDATGRIDTRGLALGRAYVTVRGRDADGNWGAASAAWVEVRPGRVFVPILAKSSGP